MAVLPILTWPDTRLATVCDPVSPGVDLTALIADMFDTMYHAPGRGLAAPQVGVMKRLFVTDTTWKEGPRSPMVFINPEIVASSDSAACADEGCLSIPGITVQVRRPKWVDLVWINAQDDTQQQRFEGFAAVCVQHEFDHLDGIVSFGRLESDARLAAETRYTEARA